MLRNLERTLGLGILVAIAAAAMSAMSASAKTSGHFFTDAPSGVTVLDISAGTGTAHTVSLEGWFFAITCHEVNYTQATASESEVSTISATDTEIKITPEYKGCTVNEEPSNVTMNGCHYSITPNGVGLHGTVHLSCPTGALAEIHSPRGTITFSTQTPTGGVAFTTATNLEGMHTITADFTVSGITAACHGLCVLVGGTHRGDASISGSVTIEGTDRVSGEPVNITHT